MANQFKTIENIAEGQFKDRGSKFLAFAFPVKTETEVNQFRADLKKKYYDAWHHVYAFHLGVENPFFRASDDGEPSNSSGPPVLGQIRSFGLTNVLVVVVRYFGGTKLGVPGLINAYKTAAFEALNSATIITKNVEYTISIIFEYIDMNAVMKLLKNEGVNILNQTFEVSCCIHASVQKDMYERLLESLSKIKSVKVNSQI